MRLGIFGGTFDPVHNGHIEVATDVFKTCRLDRMLFVPAARPPHKGECTVSSPEDRLAMVELALVDKPEFEVSRIEIDRPGNSYTVDTLSELGRAYPDAELYYVLGSDAFAELETWHEPARALHLARFVVMNRAGFETAHSKSPFRGLYMDVEVTAVDVSSTMLRRMVSEGLSIRELAPGLVADYIGSHSLYKGPVSVPEKNGHERC